MILFITRKYPPSVGGMQNFSYHLTTNVAELAPAQIIAWGRSQAWLPWFVIVAACKSLWAIWNHHVSVIHLGDALLLPLGCCLRWVARAPLSVTVHGRDLTFEFPPYQWMIRHFLKRADQVIAVSHATAEEAIARGLEAAKTRVIANGIAASAVCHAKASERDRHALEQAVGRPLMGKKILLTVGRLVQRKGVRHCVENILPHVFARRGDVVYLVVGEGKHRSEIEAAIARAGYQDSVFLLGRVSDELLGAVMRLAHVFVMPNVQVPGDMEGFGIAAIEASLAGLPVVASGIEGIRDAVVEGCNGFLITPQQPKAFAEKILTLLENEAERARFGNAGRQFTLEKFNWRHIAGEYLEAFEQLCAGKCKRSVSSISNVVSKKAGKLSTITPASGLNKLRQ